jgi:hypothetical protein
MSIAKCGAVEGSRAKFAMQRDLEIFEADFLNTSEALH